MAILMVCCKKYIYKIKQKSTTSNPPGLHPGILQEILHSSLTDAFSNPENIFPVTFPRCFEEGIHYKQSSTALALSFSFSQLRRKQSSVCSRSYPYDFYNTGSEVYYVWQWGLFLRRWLLLGWVMFKEAAGPDSRQAGWYCVASQHSYLLDECMYEPLDIQHTQKM